MEVMSCNFVNRKLKRITLTLLYKNMKSVNACKKSYNKLGVKKKKKINKCFVKNMLHNIIKKTTSRHGVSIFWPTYHSISM